MVQIIQSLMKNMKQMHSLDSLLLFPHVFLHCVRTTQDTYCCQNICGGLLFSPPSFRSNPTYPCGPTTNTMINTKRREGKQARKATGETGRGTFSSCVTLAGPSISKCYQELLAKICAETTSKSDVNTNACHCQTN